MLTFVIILCVAIVGLCVVSTWRLFEKAGRAGWKSLIPVYNTVVLCKIANVSPWLLLIYLIPFVRYFGIVLQLYMCNGICVNFNKKGIGFVIGAWLLPFIFFPILAFGSSEYQNPEEA